MGTHLGLWPKLFLFLPIASYWLEPKSLTRHPNYLASDGK
jgi:hypothetical protein